MVEQSKFIKLQTHIIKTGVFVILLLPLFIFHHSLFPFVFPRTMLFRLIVEILFAVYISLALMAPRYRPPLQSPLLWLMTGFLALMILTSIGNFDWHHSLWSSYERSEGILTWIHLYLFFIVILGIAKKKDDWLQFFNVLIIAGWLQVLYGLAQFFDLPFVLVTTGVRLNGTIGNPSFLAAILIFINFIAAWMLTQYKSVQARLYYGLLIIFGLLLLWQTETRGAILATSLGLIVLMGIYFWQNRRKFIGKFSLLIVISIISISIFAFLSKDADWVRKSGSLHRLTSISATDITSQNRLIVWNVGWQAFKERPVWGWGWENFNIAFNKYFDAQITRDIGSRPWYDRAHNIFVELGVSLGIFGILLYVAMFMAAYWLLWRAYKLKQSNGWQTAIVATMLAAYAFQNLFVFDTINSYLLFFLVLAFIQWQGIDYETHDSQDYKKKGLIKPTQFGPLLLLLILLVPIVYWYNVRPALASYYVVKAVTRDKTDTDKIHENFKKAFTLSPPADQELRFMLVQQTRDRIQREGITEQAVPLIKFTLEEMNKTIKAAPYIVQNYLILAEIYLSTNRYESTHTQKAKEISLQALDLAPQRYQTYFMLGRLEMEQGNFDQGIDYFKQAVHLNDRFAEAYWNLAVAHILAGRASEAQEYLNKATELNFVVYNEKNIEKLLTAFRDSRDISATIDFTASMIERFPDNESLRIIHDELQSIYEKLFPKEELISQ